MQVVAKRYRPVFFGVLLALVVLAAVGVCFMLPLGSGIDDGYALWGAGEMVIDYLKKHDGKWPRSWDDLRPQFSVNNGRVGGWSFSQFQDRIRIDFNADPDDLRRKCAESSHATFQVIWAKRDSGVRVGDDPNQTLCDYFRQQEKRGRAAGDPGGGKKEPPK